ncbi:MAG: MraY family glycosyltransferase [Patescibacteria group bacterium]
MAPYYISALVSSIVAYLLVWLFKTYAVEKNIFSAEIRQRDIHKTPTPRVGGIAIVVTFLLVSLGAYLVSPESFKFIDGQIGGIDKNFLGLVIAVVVLSVVNIADDFKNIKWPLKLATQVTAALIIAAFGVKVAWLTTFGWDLALNGYIAWIFIVIWLVVLANVVNWVDSIDGLAGGTSMIAMAVLFILSISRGDQSGSALLAAIVFGALAGFLPHNFMAKKAFLGDTGAVFLGFIIGVLAIISGGKVIVAFLVMAIPILDAAVVFFGRIINRQSPFLPDNRHLTHRLLAMGLAVWQINAIYFSISLALGLAALNTQKTGQYYLIFLALTAMAGFVLLYSKQAKNN